MRHRVIFAQIQWYIFNPVVWSNPSLAQSLIHSFHPSIRIRHVTSAGTFPIRRQRRRRCCKNKFPLVEFYPGVDWPFHRLYSFNRWTFTTDHINSSRQGAFHFAVQWTNLISNDSITGYITTTSRSNRGRRSTRLTTSHMERRTQRHPASDRRTNRRLPSEAKTQ